ncbi:gypsy-like retrotransposase [Cucumis melo var. makuwa]|uniref:Gypsy-like retrotransposase n=1 Tax=Cucumis melo var. makuwa TaxID=1194695 RepID=A0A5A7VFH5_CUCMM|nr:gypsy-like retrotransposase [Cucumis melo var. makuwa]TYK30269.1 gypsy-like retrotransposase [Cucumis melo var. makuwa]
MLEEDKDFSRPQHLVTLAVFFPTGFRWDHQDENPYVIACYAINAMEEESIPPKSLGEKRVSKDLSRFNMNNLLSLPQETKTILIDALLNSGASSSSAPTITYESTPYSISIDFSDEDLLFDLNFILDPDMILDTFENKESTGFSSIMDQLSTKCRSRGDASTGTTKSMILMDEKTSNPPVLYYVPLSRSKKGESPFVESPKDLKVGDIEVLKKSFTPLLTKITKQEKKIDLAEANMPQRRTIDGFDPKAYKLMVKASYDFIAHTEFKSLKIHEQLEPSLTQKKLLR